MTLLYEDNFLLDNILSIVYQIDNIIGEQKSNQCLL
jgi:hypothetical protein